jgi:hypothetical protein
LAVLLQFLISFSLISPLLALPTESNLPSCCKRDGKHRCFLSTHTKSTSVAWQAQPTRCSQFPQLKAQPAPSLAYFTRDQSSQPSQPTQTRLLPQTQHTYQSPSNNRLQDRGPPALHS